LNAGGVPCFDYPEQAYAFCPHAALRAGEGKPQALKTRSRALARFQRDYFNGIFFSFIDGCEKV
jgi:hypothetical protein